jgi:hypothetical protein
LAAVVATADKAAGTDVLGSMAERAGEPRSPRPRARTMISRPETVAEMILTAAAAVDRAAVGAR